MKVLLAEKLESLLQAKWTEFLDRQQLMRLCLEYARDSAYRTLKQKEIPPVQVKLSVTHFEITNNPFDFELWVEFIVPKDGGVVVGTHIVSLNLDGTVKLKESHGTHFVVETS